MDGRMISKLEREVENAVDQAFKGMKSGQLPRRPNRRITHLMAKAAVAVYEAAEEAPGAE